MKWTLENMGKILFSVLSGNIIIKLKENPVAEWKKGKRKKVQKLPFLFC